MTERVELMFNNCFAKLDLAHSKIALEDVGTNKVAVLHIDSQHEFIQATGYAKYLAGQRGNVVAIRGQRLLYETGVVPTLYRGVTSQKMKTMREEKLNSLLKELPGKALDRIPRPLHEPLLQHYGVTSRWLDLVDNVWVALWFSCHRAHSLPGAPQFLHFERRRVDSTEERQTQERGPFAYVLLFELERGDEAAECRGLFEGFKSSWVDLRIAASSHFVRPHAQHGILFRRRSYEDHKNIDCNHLVAGVIRIALADALRWLGEGHSLGVHAFFPPPKYDYGYRELLREMPPIDISLGAIQHIGA